MAELLASYIKARRGMCLLHASAPGSLLDVPDCTRTGTQYSSATMSQQAAQPGNAQLESQCASVSRARLSCHNRQGDLVTVTARADLQRAMQEVISASQAGPHGPRLSNALDPIRLQLVPVDKPVRFRHQVGSCISGRQRVERPRQSLGQSAAGDRV